MTVTLCQESLHGHDEVFRDRCHDLKIQHFHSASMAVAVGFSKHLETIGDASRTRLKNRHEAALLLQVSFHAKRRNRHHRKNSSARIEHRDPYIRDAHHLRTRRVVEAVCADFLQM